MLYRITHKRILRVRLIMILESVSNLYLLSIKNIKNTF